MSPKTKFGIAAAVALLLAGAMCVPLYYLVSYARGIDLYKRGVAEIDGGRPDEAIALLDAAAQKNLDATSMSYVYEYRGWAHLSKGRDEKAIGDFSESLRLNPKSVFAVMNRGLAYHRQGEFEKAFTDYSEALALDPNLAEAYHKRAQIHEGRGDRAQAIADYGEAIRCEPENAQLFVDRGMAFAANNELDSAIVNFDAAIGFNQTHAGAYIQRALAYGRKGNLPKGLADVTEAIHRLPKARQLRYARAMIYLDRGVVEEAIADCNESIRLDSGYDLGYATRARAHLLMRDWERVLGDTATALELNPQLSDAHYLRGRAFTARGRFEEATEEYDKALRLEPGFQWALIWRALNYSYRREPARALHELTQILGRFPRSDIPHTGLAWFLATCREPAFRNGPEAVAAGLKGCEISYWSDWAAVDALAAAYAESGDFNRALQFVHYALGLPATSPVDRLLLEERLSLYRDRVAIRDWGASGVSPNPIEEGISAFARHEYDRALRCFNSVLPPNSGDSTSVTAGPFVDGTHDKASGIPAASDGPAWTNAFYYRGLAYHQKQMLDHAIADFTTVIHREPKSKLALSRRGECYGAKREAEKALRDFDAVIHLNPEDALAYVRRSETLQLLKQWDAALDAAMTAVQLGPKRDLVYLTRGQAYLGRKEYENAIRDFDEAARLEPNRPGNFLAKARLFRLKGDYKSAQTGYRQAVERFPRSADAHNSLAWFLATCSDAAYRNGAEAVKHAQSACELTEWKNEAELDTLAAAHAEAGDFDQAVNFATQAISKLEPDAAGREGFEERLALFQRKEPYRAKPPE